MARRTWCEYFDEWWNITESIHSAGVNSEDDPVVLLLTTDSDGGGGNNET